jgi:hypothetical protein
MIRRFVPEARLSSQTRKNLQKPVLPACFPDPLRIAKARARLEQKGSKSILAAKTADVHSNFGSGTKVSKPAMACKRVRLP